MAVAWNWEAFCKDQGHSCHEDDQVANPNPKPQAHGHKTQEVWCNEVDEGYDEEEQKGIEEADEILDYILQCCILWLVQLDTELCCFVVYSHKKLKWRRSN